MIEICCVWIWHEWDIRHCLNVSRYIFNMIEMSCLSVTPILPKSPRFLPSNICPSPHEDLKTLCKFSNWILGFVYRALENVCKSWSKIGETPWAIWGTSLFPLRLCHRTELIKRKTKIFPWMKYLLGRSKYFLSEYFCNFLFHIMWFAGWQIAVHRPARWEYRVVHRHGIRRWATVYTSL